MHHAFFNLLALWVRFFLEFDHFLYYGSGFENTLDPDPQLWCSLGADRTRQVAGGGRQVAGEIKRYRDKRDKLENVSYCIAITYV